MSNQTLQQELLRDTRILIVDDSKTARLMLRDFCEQAGFKHIADAADGKEALQKIEAERPALLLLDMEMPVMDGLGLCRELKKRNLMQDMVVVIQTASQSSEFKAQAFELGVADLISKPLDRRETTARIMAQLERHCLERRMEADYRRLQSELNDATMLQHIILPKEDLLESIRSAEGLDIAHYYHPATELGGDYLSVRRLEDGRIALICVDISGHGVTAALYAFSIHTLLEDEALTSQRPSDILTQLNSKLHGLMGMGKFATMFICIIDVAGGKFSYASAAAPPAVLWSKSGVRLLDTKGHLLGVQEHAEFDDYEIPYEKGDMLFLYSDALMETPNAAGQHMKETEIMKLISDKAGATSHEILKEVLVAFYVGYSRYPADDLSMLACRF